MAHVEAQVHGKVRLVEQLECVSVTPEGAKLAGDVPISC
jgi:hypothetical protein